MTSKGRWDTDTIDGIGEDSAMYFATIHSDGIDALHSRGTVLDGEDMRPSVDVVVGRSSHEHDYDVR